MNGIPFVPASEFRRLMEAGLDRFDRLTIVSDLCRLNALSAIKRAGSGHIGSSLSSMDLFTYLYFEELNTTKLGLDNPNRDIFFSSKGHDAPAQYAVLCAAGVLDARALLTLRRLGGLEGHPEITTPGIEANCGSLGMGISKARGIAYAKRLSGRGGKVFVLTGDGEFQEGQIWEALRATAHQRMDALTVIVDANTIQTDRPVKEISDLGDLEAKLRAFGWHVERCNGHDVRVLRQVFNTLRGVTGRPQILIADTIKGKGVSFMEHTAMTDGLYRWHSGAPDDESFGRAVRELTDRADAWLRDRRVAPVALEYPAVERRPAYPVSDERIVTAYGRALTDIGERRKDVVVLDADLSADCGLRAFEERFPARFVEHGIAEQDMVSMAGGLALQGYLPIVHSFSAFLAARANEQIYNNASEGTKVLYVCNYAGVLPAGAGQSHQAVRDLSLFGALPRCVAVEPCNAAEAAWLLDWCVNEARESCMLRLSLFPSPGPIHLPDDYRVTEGRGVALREGHDAVVFAYGPVMVYEALHAAERLASDGVSLKVVNLPWLNRVDPRWFEETVGACAVIAVMDNHAPVGGLGDHLANLVLESDALRDRRFRKLAVSGMPVCGAPAEVLHFHGLDGESIARTVKAALSPVKG
ncbi:MAG: transketolase C-terminal domain-containing protein [Nitrospirota bacterium]